MDVPIDVLEWELFVPEQFRADRFGGNVVDASLMTINASGYGYGYGTGSGGGGGGRALPAPPPPPPPMMAQVVGRVVDTTGAALPGVSVTVQNGSHRQTAITDGNGIYVVSNVPPGTVTLTTQLAGFKENRQTLRFSGQGARMDFTMDIGGVTETMNVQSESPAVQASKDSRAANQAPSANVQNLQRRASGVLPIRIDVPRTGTSHAFVKPLVIDEEAVVTFRYKRR
jgi:hypothetical protein